MERRGAWSRSSESAHGLKTHVPSLGPVARIPRKASMAGALLLAGGDDDGGLDRFESRRKLVAEA
jgi:hypothetical protein